jgi:hypothetical protein
MTGWQSISHRCGCSESLDHSLGGTPTGRAVDGLPGVRRFWPGGREDHHRSHSAYPHQIPSLTHFPFVNFFQLYN